MEQSRRVRFTNTAPTAGEFAAAVLAGAGFLILVTPLVVQGFVAWATSGDFAWPNGRLLEAYRGLLGGHFGAGLSRGAAQALPPDAVMWILTAVGEIAGVGSAVLVGVRIRGLTGTSVRHGLATPAQAADALGMPRLRSSAAVVRPDLYGRTGRRTPADGKQTAHTGK